MVQPSFYGYDESGRQYLVTNTLGLANRTDYDPQTGRPVTNTTNYADGIFDPAQPDEDVAQVTEYDVHGNPIIRRDAAGRTTRTWYDTLNRAISVTTNYLPGQPQNYAGQYNLVTTYGYDEVGNRAWTTDTLGHVTWTQYDALNRAVTVTQNYLGQFNLVTTYEFDALGRQVATIDPLARRTHVAFDQLGRTLAQFDPLEQRTAYAYDALGNRTVMTDAANHVTRFEYDTLNRLITTTRYLNSNPIREVTRYDAAGNRVATIDARGQTATYGYDALGRTIAITDADQHVTTFAYDALGRRTAQTDALQHTTVYTPDRMGRQIATADPLGNTTRYGYDVTGNRVVMTDANQIVTRYEYDALDRLSAVIENDTGGAQTADRDVRTTYAYDVMGNRTVMTNARGYATMYEYDALNRLSRMQDARGKATLTGYDAVGNRTVLTDANNHVTLYAYDALNRQAAITYTADATTVRYAYDAIGNRTAMTDAIGTTRYTFDDLSRLTNVVDPYNQTVGYIYDPAGNRTNVIYPDGKVVTYTYDAAGLMTGVIDWAGQTTAYAYDAANRLITVTLPDSVQTVYTYDNANRLIHLSHTRLSDGALLADYAFTLDKVGNRVQVSEAMEYPGDSQAAALPPTMADAIIKAITGRRAPGLSIPAITSTLATQDLPAALSVEPREALGHEAVDQPQYSATSASLRSTSTHVERVKSIPAPAAIPLLAASNVFSDSFESGNFAAWSAAVTNTGRLSVTASAARWGAYGMRALITSTTAMYVRDDTPAAESRYRARFYFNTNSITMAANNAHELFIGRNVTGTNVFTVQLSYASSTYRLMAQAVNDSTGISSTAWYPISNTWHFVEIDWMASISSTARNGYITLWIDGVQKESKTGIDNDTRRVDEVRLGPLSGLDSGTSGTEYFDAFESRRDTYIGPVALADFTPSPISGTAPLTVTFTNTSQPTATLTAYLWKFGDGYTSTITNPVHSYAPGYYTVTLAAWNGVYSDTITKTRLITATVKADFGANPVTGTAPLTVTFTNTSQPANGITSYLWKFGDGFTSTITNPVHSYVPGYYTVTLTASAGPLSDTITKTRLITATIKANFNANPVSGAPPLTVTFTNTSQPSNAMTSYLWNFGDGFTSTITNPVHSYALGYYTVTLTAWAGTLKDVITQTNFITALAQVQANFSANPVSGTAPLTVTFTNASQPAGAITAYLWKFGDGYTSTITNPVHSYLPGYYTVTLTAWNGTYSDTLTKTRLITATVKANFSANPVSGTAPLTVTFTNTSQPADAITSYLWTFGDGYTGTITNPVHSYAPGYYTVTLTAWSGTLKDIITQTRLITASIKAGFTANPVAGNIPLTVTFTNTSQPIDGASTFSWDFGDGMTSTFVHPSHVYTREGTFGVTLTAQSGVMQDVLTRTNFITATNNTLVTGDFLVAAGGHSNPAVAYNSVRHEYLVVWQDGSGGITGQRVSDSGHLLGATITITKTPGVLPQRPHLMYDPAHDQYLVVWMPAGGYGVVEGRVVSGSGVPGTLLSFSDPLSADSTTVAVAYNPSAQAFLVIGENEGDDVSTIWGQVVANGTLSGSTFVIADEYADTTALAVNLVTGDWLAVWLDAYQIDARRVSSSGTPSGDVFTIATRAGVDNLYEVAAEADAAGNFLVVWRAGWQAASAIHGQRVTAQGMLDGSALDLVAADGSRHEQPTLAYRAGSNDFLVVWQDNRRGNYDLYGAYVSANGATYYGGLITTADQRSPVLLYNAMAQTFFLAWQDLRAPAGIYARHWLPPVANYSAAPLLGVSPLSVTFTNLTTPTIGTTYQWDFGDGVTSTIANPTHVYTTLGFLTPWLTAFQPDGQHVTFQPNALHVNPAPGQAVVVRADPATNEGQAVLAYDPIDRQYLAVWSAWSGQSNIYARRIDGGGLSVGQPVKINATSGDHQHPAVAYGAGVYLVVWTDDTTALRGRLVSPSGTLTGTEMTIFYTGNGNPAPAVDYNPITNEFYVVWVNNNSGDSDILGMRISPSGAMSDSHVIADQGGHQLAPAVAHDAAGNYLAAFMCDEFPDQFAICVQPVAGDGSLIGTATKVYGAPTNSSTPDLVYNPQTNEFLVVWVESAGGASDEVYAQRGRSDGTLVGNRLTLGAQTSGLYRPAVGYHAASNTVVAVWSDQRAGNWDAYARAIEADGSLLEDPVALEATTANQTEVTISRAGADFDLFVLYTDDGSGSPDLYGERYIPPATLFSAAPLSGTRPLTVTFTDRSTIPNSLTWRWEFGDGLTSTLPSPVHTYAQGGRYIPRLSVSNGLYTKTYTLPDNIVVFAPHRTVINYTYDGLYRLTDASYSTGQRFQYAYDAVGNRTAQTATITSTQVTNYVYDAANRLASVNGRTYTWDDNGNLVNDGTKAYTYDQANRLKAINGSGVAVAYAYNGEGARLKQIVNGAVTTYTLDLAAPLVQVLVAKDNSSDTRYVYGVTRIGEQQSGPFGWLYHLTDALGSVRQLADSSGNVQLARGYTPYGEPLWTNGTASSRYAFTGEDYDSYIKLLFLRARYYSPELARFLSKDVWQGDYTRPQSLNAWGYTEGDPINYFDPNGHDPLASAVGLRIVHGPLICLPELPASFIIVDPSLPPPPDTWFTYALATYVEGDRIYTHDHFEDDETPMRPQTDNRIEIYDANGQLLGVAKFFPGGTGDQGYTVYNWPAGVRRPAQPASFGAVTFQDRESFSATLVRWRWWRPAYNDKMVPIATLGIESVNVTAVRSFSTAIVDYAQAYLRGGDSGGGLWYKDKVIGNLRIGLGPEDTKNRNEWGNTYSLHTP